MKMQGFFMPSMLAQNMLLNLCVRMHLETFWESLGNHGKGLSPTAAMVLMFRGRLHTAMLEPSTVTQHPINAGVKPVGLRNDEVGAEELPSNMTKRSIYSGWCYLQGFKAKSDAKGNFGCISSY